MGSPILRYHLPVFLLLLLLFFKGYQCEDNTTEVKKGPEIKQSDLKTDPKDGFLKTLDVYHIDDQCHIARFGFHEDFYKVDKRGLIAKYVDVGGTSHPSCPRKKHSLFVTSEGEKYYEVNLEEVTKDGFKLNVIPHRIFFGGTAKGLGKTSNPKGALSKEEGIVYDPDISNCFIDFGSIYCLAGAKRPNSAKEYFVFRFTKNANNEFVQTAVYDFQIIHGGKPYHIIQDAQSGHIGVIYNAFDGHESTSIDIRSLYGFLRRGSLLVTNPFSARYAIGMSSKNRMRYIVAHPHGDSGPHDKKYTYFRVPFGHPSTSDKEGDSVLANWDSLDRNGRKVFGFFKDEIPDFFKLAEFSTQRCVKMIESRDYCLKDIDNTWSLSVALIIVCGVLLFIFLLFLCFLMYYLIFCVVTKRRRRRKRKHRKHRKHRKPAVSAIGAKPDDDEVDIDPDTAIQEEKPPENTFVKKVKEFGGVDYSSSSSEDPEHSQAYFSARDQFDTKASTAVNASSKTSKKDTNKNDEISKQSNADTPVTGGGATPEEHDMATGGAQGPRSVYMKPKKKKK